MRLISVLMLLCSASALAETRTVSLFQQQLRVHDVGFFEHTKIIHDFVLEKPTELNLARGNHLLATDTVYLDRNRNLSAIAVNDDQRIEWKLKDGHVVKLDCGRHPATLNSSFAARIVTFWPGGEYRGGCDLIEPTEFLVGSERLVVKDHLEVTSDSKLRYAKNVVSGSVEINGQRVALAPDHEIAIFPSQRVEFLSPAPGSAFSVHHAIYGDLTFGQLQKEIVPTVFFEDGQVQYGIVTSSFLHAPSGTQITAGSGIKFADQAPHELDAVRFTSPHVLGTGFKTSRMKWNQDTKSATYILDEEFEFHDYDSMQVYHFPAGAPVVTDATGKLLEVGMGETLREI